MLHILQPSTTRLLADLVRALSGYVTRRKRFFKRVLRSSPVPCKIVTDQLRSYPAAKAEIPELATVKHVFLKAAARLNNRAANSHRPTRER